MTRITALIDILYTFYIPVITLFIAFLGNRYGKISDRLIHELKLKNEFYTRILSLYDIITNISDKNLLLLDTIERLNGENHLLRRLNGEMGKMSSLPESFGSG